MCRISVNNENYSEQLWDKYNRAYYYVKVLFLWFEKCLEGWIKFIAITQMLFIKFLNIYLFIQSCNLTIIHSFNFKLYKQHLLYAKDYYFVQIFMLALFSLMLIKRTYFCILY